MTNHYFVTTDFIQPEGISPQWQFISREKNKIKFSNLTVETLAMAEASVKVLDAIIK